jgi:hypothetical protein
VVRIDGEPTRDIDAVINRVQWVMKAGIVYVDKRTEL